jgi:hypothetical protein
MAKRIFISRPTKLDKCFESAYLAFEKALIRKNITPIRLGASNYSLEAPLKAVIKLMKGCSGAIILGYPKYEFNYKYTIVGSSYEEISTILATPWNQIEATLAFRENLPVLVISHNGISGGIFDIGVTGQHVLSIDLSLQNWHQQITFKGLFNAWEQDLK